MFLSHPIFETRHSLARHSIEVAKKTKRILDETTLNISDLGFYAGLLHDIGKLNPLYQLAFLETNNYAVENKISELESTFIHIHSPFSEFISQSLLHKTRLCQNEKDKISAVIYYHHSSLKHTYNEKVDKRIAITQKEIANNLKAFEQEVSKIQEFSEMDWDYCHLTIVRKPLSTQFDLGEFDGDYFNDYIKNSCLFSALLQADLGSFNDWILPSFDLNINTSELVTSDSSIIDHRTRFQSQAIENIDVSNAINILKAPTGIGKTKAFLDMISKYKDFMQLDKVFYFSPLLALTDDFEKKIIEKNVISKSEINRILEYNHLYSGSLEEKITSDDYKQKTYNWSFEDESFNRNFIITTTSRLLMTLYSNRRNDKLKLISFKKSLLIIDEVQTLPKFILHNLISYLQRLTTFLHCKVLLISATIPSPLDNLPTIRIDQNIIDEYQRKTKKEITFSKTREIEAISGKKILVMANTRRKTSQIYLEYKKKFGIENVFYLSSGIRKIDRLAVFSKLRDKRYNVLCIATQVIEAGIDISFSHIYREAAPLDSIIQVMGRLNREMEYEDALLTIYQDVYDFKPYSQIEYDESVPILKQIQNSEELYSYLEGYYKKIFERNKLDKEYARLVEKYMDKMDFQTLWEEIRKKTYEETGEPVIIPSNLIEYNTLKQEILSKNKVTKEIRKNCAKNIANLPRNLQSQQLKYMFDEELFDLNFLMPKPEYLYDPNKPEREYLYDPKIGLDKWLIM